MYTLRRPAKADWSAGLCAFYQKAVSQRRVTFLIDCGGLPTGTEPRFGEPVSSKSERSIGDDAELGLSF